VVRMQEVSDGSIDHVGVGAAIENSNLLAVNA
jgi:hypothetical protein